MVAKLSLEGGARDEGRDSTSVEHLPSNIQHLQGLRCASGVRGAQDYILASFKAVSKSQTSL